MFAKQVEAALAAVHEREWTSGGVAGAPARKLNYSHYSHFYNTGLLYKWKHNRGNFVYNAEAN